VTGHRGPLVVVLQPLGAAWHAGDVGGSLTQFHRERLDELRLAQHIAASMLWSRWTRPGPALSRTPSELFAEYESFREYSCEPTSAG